VNSSTCDSVEIAGCVLAHVYIIIFFTYYYVLLLLHVKPTLFGIGLCAPVKICYWFAFYCVSQKILLTCDHNFGKCTLIYKILSLSDS